MKIELKIFIMIPLIYADYNFFRNKTEINNKNYLNKI